MDQTKSIHNKVGTQGKNFQVLSDVAPDLFDLTKKFSIWQ